MSTLYLNFVNCIKNQDYIKNVFLCSIELGSKQGPHVTFGGYISESVATNSPPPF